MSNIQKQHKISPAIAWLTIQKFIIFYCPLDREHTTGGGFFYNFYFEKIIANNCFAFGIFPLYIDIAL